MDMNTFFAPGPSRDGRVYSNSGNAPLVDLLERGCTRLLDVGCGAGDTAALIRQRAPECELFGITHSSAEVELARRFMKECWLFDIEGPIPPHIRAQQFDGLVFSHVLEHLREPAEVLARFCGLLRCGGQVLIAVPNVLSWRMRIKFLKGSFEYDDRGVLDDTHLRFFTFFTAAAYLLSETPELTVTHQLAQGSVPLWWLRRHILPRSAGESIDRWGTQRWPNLFGGQILIRAVKK